MLNYVHHFSCEKKNTQITLLSVPPFYPSMEPENIRNRGGDVQTNYYSETQEQNGKVFGLNHSFQGVGHQIVLVVDYTYHGIERTFRL